MTSFEIIIDNKKLIFDSRLKGLVVNGQEYKAEKDGVLIYDKVFDLSSDEVTLQMFTNTSTPLIPALKVLGLKYNSYFDERDVLKSQNDITLYWKPSKLADYYNRYSTDELDIADREIVIRNAVEFLTHTSDNFPLFDTMLERMNEMPELLGFYNGLPIFDSKTGFAKLQCRLGIHIDPDSIMISTPLDKYENDVYEVAEAIKKETGIEYQKKKNRVVFSKDEKVLELLLQ